MAILQNLNDLGLSEKESKIYLSLLELGESNVQDIANKTEIKRPTIYLTLGHLKERGLVSESLSHRGNKYSAQHPDNLQNMLTQKQDSLNKALPFLRAMQKANTNKTPTVQIFEGKEGMLVCYKNGIYSTTDEILFFASIKKMNNLYPDFFSNWNSMERHRKYPSKELLQTTTEDVLYAKKASAKRTKQEFRFLPKNSNLNFFGTDSAIFDNKVMLVSYEQKLFTILIESEVIANAMRSLYMLAWSAAVPAKKLL